MTSQDKQSTAVRSRLERIGSHRCVRGLLLGGLAGIIFANVEVLAIALFAYLIWSVKVNPFTPLIASLYVQEALQLSLFSALLAGLGGRWLEGRPYRHLCVLIACLLPLPFLLRTTAPLVVCGAMLLALPLSCLGVRVLRWRSSMRIFALVLLITGPVPLLFVLPGAGAIPASGNRPSPPVDAPNILWVVFDTTRADHLSLYGYPHRTSPNLDRLAADSTVFNQAYSTAPWTAPSHASMLTGLYPRQHGCTFEHTYLASDIPFLPEILTRAGYDTALFAGNPWLDTHSGLNRGFLHTVPSWRSSFTSWFMLVGAVRRHLALSEVDKGAANSNAELERWLERRTGPRPFFAFVNYTEAHAPYFDIPAGDRDAFVPAGVNLREQKAVSQRLMNSQLRTQFEAQALPDRDRKIAAAMYDGGIRYEDRRLGEVIELLRRRGELDKTLVIVTADHGELLGEHGEYGHDQTLYHPLVRVPLVLRWPTHVPSGVRIDAPVQLTDLFATVLELTGQAGILAPEARSRSLSAALNGTAPPDRPVFAELYPPLRSPRAIERLRRLGIDPLTYRFTSVQASHLRFIRGPASTERLFDLSTDPGEEHDILASREAEAREMRAHFEQFERDFPKGNAPALPANGPDAMTREKLESLGYVH